MLLYFLNYVKEGGNNETDVFPIKLLTGKIDVFRIENGISADVYRL